MKKCICGVICILLLTSCKQPLSKGISAVGSYDSLNGIVLSVDKDSFDFVDDKGNAYRVKSSIKVSDNEHVSVTYDGNKSGTGLIKNIDGSLEYHEKSLVTLYLDVLDEILLYDPIDENVTNIAIDVENALELTDLEKSYLRETIRQSYGVNNVFYQSYDELLESFRIVDGKYQNGVAIVIRCDDEDKLTFTLTKYRENLQHVSFGFKASHYGENYYYKITSATSNVTNEEEMKGE